MEIIVRHIFIEARNIILTMTTQGREISAVKDQQLKEAAEKSARSVFGK